MNLYLLIILSFLFCVSFALGMFYIGKKLNHQNVSKTLFWVIAVSFLCGLCMLTMMILLS
ncbi:MAG: hypothetical protein HYU67_11600 [Flavobacteriia bacterium]|nr:hypothetical protein [Flavobacteriia bacterium]